MVKILLDTNILIYKDGNKESSDKVIKLIRNIYDDYKRKIYIHPLSVKEASRIKDPDEKKVFLSKLAMYNQLKNPPLAPTDFHQTIGCHSENDEVDNNLIFCIKRNCCDFLISNDKKIIKKAKQLGLERRILGIEEAIQKFPVSNEETQSEIAPVFINYEYLYNIDIEDHFFNTLKKDYLGFSDWYAKKSLKEKRAYITRNINTNEITSFLMLKVEDINEKYNFEKQMTKTKKLKVATMKVSDTGKKIGETFIKIMIQEAINNDCEEIYVTVFPKYKYLISLLEQYGFEYYTKHQVSNSDGYSKDENVMIKKMDKESKIYPYLNIEDRDFFVIPIKPHFHERLFPETEQLKQISFEDLKGESTMANAIKKAYICHSNTNQLKSGDIIFFYCTHPKKAITTIGVVEAVFSKLDDFEEFERIVKKRTVYCNKELKRMFTLGVKIIIFKHYYWFQEKLERSYLIENKIVNGNIQCITKLTKDAGQKLLKQCKINKEMIKF